MKKIYIKEDKMPLLEYYNSPDCVHIEDENGEEDEVLTFDDNEAVPFIVLNDLEIKLGKYGSSHFFIKINMEDEGDDRDIVAEGRVWTKSNIITFWYSEKLNVNLINHIIFELYGEELLDIETLRIVFDGELMDYNDFLISTEKESDETMKYFEDGQYDKTDYYYPDEDEEDDDSNENEQERIRNIHLMNQQDKRNALNDYRKNKEAKIGKQLSSYDEDGNFKSEMPMAQWRALHSTSESKEVRQIIENFEFEIEPNEVDLSSFKKENELYPKIWDGDVLDSRVRLKLLDIADDFYDCLNIKWTDPADIILTGSICNYNWSNFSDIDLHIVIDFNEICDNKDLVKEFFDAKKNEWNNEHDDLTVYGLKVELYVQDVDEDAVSDGVYSLEKNEWVNKPNIDDVKPLKEVNSDIVKLISSSIMTRIDDLSDMVNNTDDIAKLRMINDKCENLNDKIRSMRKNSLSNYGEYSVGNICYKVLRRFKYLDKLWDLRIELYDKINSID